MARTRKLRAVADQPARAAIYVRVSALMGRGGDDFHSPGMQTDAARRMITAAGLREVDVIQDIDRSGQTFQREGIDQIRAMVQARQIDVVAVYDLSRLGRNLAEALTFIRWLRDHGVSVMSTQERIDDTPEGQFMLSQFLGLAELYGAQVGRRWAQIAERRARQGKHHGVVPAGYIKVDGRLEVDPRLGPAVTRMFEAYAAGHYISDIQREYAAVRGKPVRRNVIKWMLSSKIYRGRVVLRSKTGGEIDLPGEHPPLVDETTWEKAQRRLAADRVTPPRRLEPAYGLTGIVWCAHCHGALQVWYSISGGRRERRMVCSRQRQIGDCKGPGTPLYAHLETAILDELQAWAGRLRGNPTTAARKAAQAARAAVDVSALKRELADTRDAMGRITEQWARQKMPQVAYEKAMASLVEAEARLADQLGKVEQVRDAPDAGRSVALVEELRRMWPDLTEPERNRGLREVMVRVRVRRADRWREPVADRLVDWEMR